MVFISASSSRHHVFLGLPLFRFPCGFHVRACLVMLFAGLRKVCPIHLQCRFLISSSAGSWFVFCHSLLLLVSGQRICKILSRQLLMKTSTFLVMAAVLLQVSARYKRTALTLVLKILTLVLTDSSLDLQMFRSCINAVHAFPIRALTSASEPPCLLMTLRHPPPSEHLRQT